MLYHSYRRQLHENPTHGRGYNAVRFGESFGLAPRAFSTSDVQSQSCSKGWLLDPVSILQNQYTWIGKILRKNCDQLIKKQVDRLSWVDFALFNNFDIDIETTEV